MGSQPGQDRHCTECPNGWNMTDYSKRTCGRAIVKEIGPVTLSVILSVEESTVMSVVEAYQPQHSMYLENS